MSQSKNFSLACQMSAEEVTLMHCKKLLVKSKNKFFLNLLIFHLIFNSNRALLKLSSIFSSSTTREEKLRVGLWCEVKMKLSSNLMERHNERRASERGKVEKSWNIFSVLLSTSSIFIISYCFDIDSEPVSHWEEPDENFSHSLHWNIRELFIEAKSQAL